MLNFFKKQDLPTVKFLLGRGIDQESTNLWNTLGNMYPVIPASTDLPEWWSKLGKSYLNEQDFTEYPTAKRCPGMYDLMRAGYIIPAWSDFEFMLGSGMDIKYKMSPILEKFKDPPFHIHRPEQTSGCPMHSNDTGPILKLMSPWYIDMPKDYSIFLIEPTYAQTNDYSVLPGIMDPAIERAPNKEINVFIRLNKPDKVIKINAGDPLIHIIPFKRQSFKFECRLPDNEEKSFFNALQNKPFSKILRGIQDMPAKLAENRFKDNKNYNVQTQRRNKT